MRRFWWLLAPGVVLAILLSLFSYVRITPNGLAYREKEVWQSQTMLLLTQKGFLWGRTSWPVGVDPGRFSSLTELYSQFANSDQVRQIMRHDGAPQAWKISADPIVPAVPGTTLPMIALSGQAFSARESVAATAYGRRALIEYVKSQQAQAEIPKGLRIDIQVIKRATKPIVVVPRKKVLPILVFFAVVAAAFGLAVVLENLTPPVRAVAQQGEAEPAPLSGTRRTA